MGILSIVGFTLLLAIIAFGLALRQEDFKPSARMTTKDLKWFIFLDFVLAVAWFWLAPQVTVVVAVLTFCTVAMFDVSRWLGARHYNRKENINQ